MRQQPEEPKRFARFLLPATVAFRAATLRCVVALAATSVPLSAISGQATDDIRIVETQGVVKISRTGSSAWVPAQTNQTLRAFDLVQTGSDSRVALRWSDQSVVAFSALTEVEILPPDALKSDSGLHLIRGILSFFHRDEPGRIRVITRGAVAGVEGTEFVLTVTDADRTMLSVIDGRISFGNQRATLLLTNGQQAFADLGNPPVRTAGFIANNILQWTFYYPAVLDPDELALTQAEENSLRDSLDAYRSGDLLAALAKYPDAQSENSDNERVYHAALLLSVGQVEEAEGLLPPVAAGATNRSEYLATAIRQLIAAVKRQPSVTNPNPQLATEFLAQSYYEQSRTIPKISLPSALQLARRATAKSPGFGFAWERLSELEFGFGHDRRAMDALARSIAIAPRNAQALALRGFMLAARNRIPEAITSFDRALAVDAALGNAWLGRGLCRIRQGDAAGGREDLLVAAALEPQRAELRSYLGKAYANGGDYARAYKELGLAKKLDPNDPTAWFYSALLEQRDNKINDAAVDLEKSDELNDNRRVYRSQLLLDQDRAVRSANLAAVYQDAGMTEVGLLEASQAVNDDYGNYSAHLFLANSYSQLVDPNEISLRYETAMESEYLLANLLSPAAAGTMSPALSQQEYSRLFDSNRPGFTSDTEYLSRGAWTQVATQYGTEGDFSYNLEEDYKSDPGERANEDFQQQEYTLTLKQQLTPRDTVYVQALGYDASGGDLHQYYSTNMANPAFRFKETQEPTVVLGYHHEEAPGVHTLLLLARIEDTYSFTNPAQPTLLAYNPVGSLTAVDGTTMHQSYEDQLAIYSAELQQIWQTTEHNTIVGVRLQYGTFQTASLQALPATFAFDFPRPPAPSAQQDVDSYFSRASFYGYQEWKVSDFLELSAGLTYDGMTFPANFQTAPVSTEEQSTHEISPKAGVIWTPAKDTAVHFAYTRSVGGTSMDQSYQIEPSQVAGFVQSFRSLIPESVAAESPGAKFETCGISLEQKFPGETYMTLSGEIMNSKVNEVAGAFDVSSAPYASVSGLNENLDYYEKTLQFTVNQLLGEEWSLGARYEISQAVLNNSFIDVAENLHFINFVPRQRTEGTLQQSELFAIYNHWSGLFLKGEALWNDQHNEGYTPNLPAADFWQLNAFAGYRFWRRKAEFRVGVLNIAGQDYDLNPLNIHEEYPRRRTLTIRLRLNF